MPNDRRLLAAFRPFAGLFGLALASSALAALFDGGTVVLLIPFLKILFGTAGPLSSGNTTLEAWVSRALAPLVEGHDAARAVLVVMVLLLTALVLKNVFTYVHSQTIVRIQEGVVRDLRKRLFDHLLVVDLGFFQQTRFGQLVAALIADADQARLAVPALLSLLIQNAVMVLTAFVILATLSWRLTLITLATAPVLLIGVQILVRRVRRLASARADERGHMTAIASERLAAMKLIRVSGTAASESAGFGEVVDRYRKRVIRTQRFSSLTGPVTEVFAGVVLVLVIWGATRPALVGAPLGPEATIAFLLAALKAMSPLKALTSYPAQWATAMAGADRVFRYLDLPAAEREETGVGTASFEREIVFDRVSFRYAAEEPMVLEDISFQAPRGSVVALVGPSGAGKTTLVELLPRFWDPTSGEIRIDGVSVARLSRASLRKLMAVVGQDTVLLNDTVLANIAYGVPDASRARVEAAAEAANATEFIAQLPGGYETVLGERGTRLSGGQRQRIAIARALLRDAPILILDEATSALDTESERLVQQAIERLMHDRTVFVIAHRLATVRHADQLLVLDRGRVAERGTHDQLLQAGGLYRRLHDLQFLAPQETGTA